MCDLQNYRLVFHIVSHFPSKPADCIIETILGSADKWNYLVILHTVKYICMCAIKISIIPSACQTKTSRTKRISNATHLSHGCRTLFPHRKNVKVVNWSLMKHLGSSKKQFHVSNKFKQLQPILHKLLHVECFDKGKD